MTVDPDDPTVTIPLDPTGKTVIPLRRPASPPSLLVDVALGALLGLGIAMVGLGVWALLQRVGAR